VRTDLLVPTDGTNRVIKPNNVRLVQHVARREVKIGVLF
jgi:hypothetical protein